MDKRKKNEINEVKEMSSMVLIVPAIVITVWGIYMYIMQETKVGKRIERWLWK